MRKMLSKVLELVCKVLWHNFEVRTGTVSFYYKTEGEAEWRYEHKHPKLLVCKICGHSPLNKTNIAGSDKPLALDSLTMHKE